MVIAIHSMKTTMKTRIKTNASIIRLARKRVCGILKDNKDVTFKYSNKTVNVITMNRLHEFGFYETWYCISHEAKGNTSTLECKDFDFIVDTILNLIDFKKYYLKRTYKRFNNMCIIMSKLKGCLCQRM